MNCPIRRLLATRCLRWAKWRDLKHYYSQLNGMGRATGYDKPVLRLRLFTLAAMLSAALPAQAATVLVLRFHNDSQYSDLNWVGESVAGTLLQEYGQAGQIVPDREARAEGMKRLGLRPDADFTKATLIRLG